MIQSTRKKHCANILIKSRGNINKIKQREREKERETKRACERNRVSARDKETDIVRT